MTPGSRDPFADTLSYRIVAHALLRVGEAKHTGQALSPDKVTDCWYLWSGLISTPAPGDEMRWRTYETACVAGRSV
jgi:hypothetical protein